VSRIKFLCLGHLGELLLPNNECTILLQLHRTGTRLRVWNEEKPESLNRIQKGQARNKPSGIARVHPSALLMQSQSSGLLHF